MPVSVAFLEMVEPLATAGVEVRRQVVADRPDGVHPGERLDVVASLGGLCGEAEAVGDRFCVPWVLLVGSRTLESHRVSFLALSAPGFHKRITNPSYATLTDMSNAKAPRKAAMRVSAIRFGVDLWRLLEVEAARVGVSVSQYVREAALVRASAAAATRGEDALERLGRAAENSIQVDDSVEPRAGDRDGAPAVSSARDVRIQAQEVRSDARAVRAQSAQISRRARQISHNREPDED